MQDVILRLNLSCRAGLSSSHLALIAGALHGFEHDVFGKIDPFSPHVDNVETSWTFFRAVLNLRGVFLEFWLVDDFFPKQVKIFALELVEGKCGDITAIGIAFYLVFLLLIIWISQLAGMADK